MDSVERIGGEMKRPTSAAQRLEGLQQSVVASRIHRPSSASDALSQAKQSQSTANVADNRGIGSLRGGPSVVKSRNGSVLSRGFILKTDFYPSGRAMDLELNLQGAPNFRSSHKNSLNVYGVAQPRIQGLRAILSLLRCRPEDSSSSHCCWISTREEPIVYISGRPFVLRDAAHPRSTMALSDRAENLEAIEERMKLDILAEGSRFGGLVLTHQEISEEETAIVPTWTAVDSASVKTARQVWSELASSGWKVEYHRIPIGPERLVEDNYLDAYVRILDRPEIYKSGSASVVFNCGMGVVRTTFGMIAASIIRRKQIITQGLADPFATQLISRGSTNSGTNTPTEVRVIQAFEQASQQQESNRALLRLTSLLQKNLSGKEAGLVTSTLLANPTLLECLKKAHQGNYEIILSLLGCLNAGLAVKCLVDNVIDSCDQVKHLREEVLTQRVKYSMQTIENTTKEDFLRKAVKALEKYFFLIIFASYVNDHDDFKETFAEWLKARHEIWNQISYLRKESKKKVLSPINDLSALSSGRNLDGRPSGPESKNVAIYGKVLGDEYMAHIVGTRRGIVLRADTVLKSDHWQEESQDSVHALRGVINFRNVPGTNIYAAGQPSVEAIASIVDKICATHLDTKAIIWITLREEPVVYINGLPYCLRRDGFTLRNMKDYGGISSSRLELLEQRLKADVISEVDTFDGRLLLHSEVDGDVIPIWEEVEAEHVKVVKEVMQTSPSANTSVKLHYHRVPITAEQAPDFSDISDLLQVVIESNLEGAPIVLNDQLGRGRSTMASIIVMLIQRWLARGRHHLKASRRRHTAAGIDSGAEAALSKPRKHSYQIINNVLRVIKHGLVVKAVVDDAIDRCAALSFNLRDSIEDSRVRAEQASEAWEKKKQIERGRHNLRRYFTLVLFQSYLDSIVLDDRQNFESFEHFLMSRPVFQTIEKELLGEEASTLKPLEPVSATDVSALPHDIKETVIARSGAVLATSTIIKSDYFSGLEKLSLSEKIEGSPNFRFVGLVSDGIASQLSRGGAVCGTGMPTLQGLKNALERLDAHPNGAAKVYWTSLREEPVVYVSGKPHVLRLIDKPLENLEATGVRAQVVEAMETTLKDDVCREVRRGEGNLLLHDEEEQHGSFKIVPVWQHVGEEDIMTPRDVYDAVLREGYKVNYERIAITDEQAPLPDALAQLFERVTLAITNKGVIVFNCQMGRGRTTTGMVVAALVTWKYGGFSEGRDGLDEEEVATSDAMDGISEEDAYIRGEYKIILKLIGVLSLGKIAKRLADSAIDMMSAIQNLRKAIFDYKLKVDACEIGSRKQHHLENVAFNYLYRYATLIVFANYLLELGQEGLGHSQVTPFPQWLKERREITTILTRLSLD